MIADLKPYPEYKESGLPWLGQMPEHWEVKRAKSIFERIDERSTTGKEELLTVSSARGIVPRNTASVTMFKAESYLGYKLCWPGDLVINSLWAWAGGLGVSRHHGIISSAYGVYRVRRDAPVTAAFVHEFVRSASFHWEIRVRSKGVWTSRLQLTDTSFLDAPMCIPPPAEQLAIVRFLDWTNGRLERAIRAKRKVIALLNEQKQAIIHRAVTRGLDASVPLKSSGIAWLRDIPVHWDVRKMKYLVSTVGGMTPNKGVARFWEGSVPWVSPKDMKRREIGDSQDHITDAALRETHISLIPPPAVLMVVRGMILARTFPTAITTVSVTVNQDMKALTPKPVLNADFLVSMLTGIQRELLNLVGESGHGTRCLRTESWANFSVPLPPVPEQVSITERLKSELAGVNSAISRLEREIELLREYRVRLVADVVTGKLDVRGAATRLPNQAPPIPARMTPS
jgi:type I restriction enzyme, S subunit